MCGILASALLRDEISENLLVRQLSTLSHRGPDNAGIWVSSDRRTALAHRRLAVIDLSSAGHQPMQRSDCVIVFNGEVYNYRELRRELQAAGADFSSGTDTEVVLQAYRAWGTSCLERLLGMFAFVIHDSARNILFGARDRVGEKPFFYRHDEHGFACASELKALLADPQAPRRMDRTALEFYLAYGYVPGDHCLLQGLRKLPAAHAFRLELVGNRLHTWRYWKLPEQRVTTETPGLLDELEALLEDSVRRQLVSDVPVGVLLSGGIDSSLVTGMAARVRGNVRTFTVTFPGQGKFDEAPYAREVARHFRTEHRELVAEPVSIDVLPRLVRQFDEPIADASMLPTFMVSQAIREHATVALGGDGGDELFGGYPHYSWLIRQQQLRRLTPPFLRQGVSWLGRHMPVGARGRNYLLGFARPLHAALGYVNLYFDAQARDSLLGEPPSRARSGGPEAHKAAIAADWPSAVQAATRTDFQTYLTDDILVKVDRASMLSSLEVRAPFLDYRIIEFAFGKLPDHLRATGSRRKVLLRRLGARLLPDTLDLTRKQGFSIPLEDWMRRGWSIRFQKILYESPLFHAPSVASLFAGQDRGLSNANRLFALSFLELWRREYDVSLPDQTVASASQAALDHASAR